MTFRVGDRVVVDNGDVGHVEALDGDWADVRTLTPRNEPSCCVTVARQSQLSDGTNIRPMPRPESWWRESREFCRLVASAVGDMDLK
jgi:hypothetical protein